MTSSAWLKLAVVRKGRCCGYPAVSGANWLGTALAGHDGGHAGSRTLAPWITSPCSAPLYGGHEAHMFRLWRDVVAPEP